MVRTLKWIYELGVRHERERIAGYLRLEGAGINNRHRDIFDQLGDRSSKPTPRNKQIELEVLEIVSSLINNIFRGEDRYIQGNSVMFPDGKEK